MRDDRPSFTDLDRPSTQEEIRRATGTSPERVLQFCQENGVVIELRNRTGTLVEFSAEELEMLIRLGTSEEVPVN